MRVLRLFARLWIAASLAALVMVAVTETVLGTGAYGISIALMGAFAGAISLPMVTQVGLLSGSAIFGLRVRHIVFGATKRLCQWKADRLTVTVRALPVTISAEIGPWRQPVILRCWLAGLISAFAGLAAVAASWVLCNGPFGRGIVIAVTPLMVYKLWPRRAPLATSTGWLLFGLPRMPEPARTEFRAAPDAARAHEALQSGQVDVAQSHVDELAERHPQLSTTIMCQITLFEARGEYRNAVELLMRHISNAAIPPRDMAYNLAGLAGLALCAVESGQLPGEVALPVATKALEDSIKLGYSSFQLSGTKALFALLEDQPAEAVRLAGIGADHNTSPLSQADDFATLARAHMALRDNMAARNALAEAEKLASWWPRVRETRKRLSVS